MSAVPGPSAPSWVAFLRFLGPLMLSNVLQSLSGTINNVYLGQMIGVQALAASTAFFPIQFFLVSLVIGISGGASVVIGQAFGAGDSDRVRAVVRTALTATILPGLVVAGAGSIFAGAVLQAIGTPPDILADATAYARVMMIALPVLFFFFMLAAMLSGVGDSLTPAIALGISTAIGLVATPVLISGRTGLPGLGVASAAFATILSFVVTLVLLVVHLRRRKHTLALDGGVLTLFRIDWTILRHVLRIGVPTGIQLVIVSLSEIAVIFLVNRFGSDATAAYGAVNQIASYAQLPTASIAIAASIFAAQAIGSGHTARLPSIVRTGIYFNLVLTGALVTLAYLLSHVLLSCFIVRPEVVDLAQGLLRITLWSYVILGIAAVFAGVMRASGTVIVPVTISILAIVFIEVPVAWWLSMRIGINGIWYAYPTAFVAMLFLQAGYFRLFWKRKAVTPLDEHNLVQQSHRRDLGVS